MEDYASIIHETCQICDDIELQLNLFEVEFPKVDPKFESFDFKKSVKKLFSGLITFIKTTWKSFVISIRRIVQEISNKLKKKHDKETGIIAGNITFDGNKFSLVKYNYSKSSVLEAFSSSLYNIIIFIKDFVSAQIESIRNTIRRYFYNETGRIEVFKSNHYSLSTGDTVSMIGDDALNSDEKALITGLRDVQYDLILSADNTVEAYNLFLLGEIQKCKKVLSKRNEYDKKLKIDVNNLYQKVSTKEFDSPYESNLYFAKRIRRLVENHASHAHFISGMGNAMNLIISDIRDIQDRYAKLGLMRPSDEDLLKGVIKTGSLWFNKDPEIIKKVIKLRVNYNNRMRDILSRIVYQNYELLEIPKIQAEILSRIVKNRNTPYSYNRILQIIMNKGKNCLLNLMVK